MLSGVTLAIFHWPLAPPCASRRARSARASLAVSCQLRSLVPRLYNRYSMHGFPRISFSSWGMGTGEDSTASTRSFLSNFNLAPFRVSDQSSSVRGW